MTIPIRVEVDDSRARRTYSRLFRGFAKMEPVMRGPVKQLVLNSIRQQFDTRGAYGGGGKPWKELAPATLAKKARAGKAGKGPLRFTDKLFKSMTQKESANRIERIGPRSYTLISKVKSKNGFPYGASHQTGTANGRVPMRQIVPDPMPESFMRQLRRIIRGYLIDVQFGEDE